MSVIDQPTESMRNTGTTAATTRHTATPRVRGMLARGNKRMKAHRSWAPRRSRCHQRRIRSSSLGRFRGALQHELPRRRLVLSVYPELIYERNVSVPHVRWATTANCRTEKPVPAC